MGRILARTLPAEDAALTSLGLGPAEPEDAALTSLGLGPAEPEDVTLTSLGLGCYPLSLHHSYDTS